jgi:peptide/nickel transport system ATP-binding protein
VGAAITELLIEIQQNEGTTLLVISHDLGFVRYMADRVVVMYIGQVMESGTTAEVLPHHATPIPRRCCRRYRWLIPPFSAGGSCWKARSRVHCHHRAGARSTRDCHRMISPRRETENPADQRLSEGSRRNVCHIPADELAQTGAIFTSAPS